MLVDVGGANPWFVLVGEGFGWVAGGLFVGGGSAALVVVGVLVSWLVVPVGNRWLVRVGWFVVGIVWFSKCVLCFSSKKADKELTFFFLPCSFLYQIFGIWQDFCRVLLQSLLLMLLLLQWARILCLEFCHYLFDFPLSHPLIPTSCNTVALPLFISTPFLLGGGGPSHHLCNLIPAPASPIKHLHDKSSYRACTPQTYPFAGIWHQQTRNKHRSCC